MRVYLRDINGTSWSDITKDCVDTGFKLRRGYNNLGSSPDVTKLSIKYKANDLASASFFHSTEKRIRLTRDDGTVLFEGISEGQSSVEATAISNLAFVNVSAYSYTKVFEKAVADEDILIFNKAILDPNNSANSLVHLLANYCISKLPTKYKSLFSSTMQIVTNITIGEKLQLCKIEKGENIITVFNKLLEEYGLARYMLGATMIVVRPYSSIGAKPFKTLSFNNVESDISIKNAPYRESSKHIVTIGKIEKAQTGGQVFILRDDNSGDPDLINVSEYYPKEGVLSFEYKTNDCSETKKIFHTEGLTYSIDSKSTINEQVTLEATTSNMGSTGAEFRLYNSDSKAGYLNNIIIRAEHIYYLNTSEVVEQESTADSALKDISIQTRFIQNTLNAKAYIEFLKNEELSNTSNYTIKTNEDIEPNTVLEVGDLPNRILVKYIEEDVKSGTKTLYGVIYSLTPASTSMKLLQAGISTSPYIELDITPNQINIDASGNLDPPNQQVLATVRRVGTAGTPTWLVNGVVQRIRETQIQVPLIFGTDKRISVSVLVDGYRKDSFVYVIQDSESKNFLSLTANKEVFFTDESGEPYSNQLAKIQAITPNIESVKWFINDVYVTKNRESIVVTPEMLARNPIKITDRDNLPEPLLYLLENIGVKDDRSIQIWLNQYIPFDVSEDEPFYIGGPGITATTEEDGNDYYIRDSNSTNLLLKGVSMLKIGTQVIQFGNDYLYNLNMEE